MQRSGSQTQAAAALEGPTSRSSDREVACKLLGPGLEPLAASCSSCGCLVAEQAPPNQQLRAERRPVSVIVGAGPAGILSAVYLARRGHEVHVYERRPSPLVSDCSDHRAFVIMLQPRGQRALATAGFDLPTLAAPGSELHHVGRAAQGAGGKPWLHFPTPRLVGPRHAFCCAMLKQAQAMHPHTITWHWETVFEGADLAAKTATFSTAATDGTCSNQGGSKGSNSSSSGGSAAPSQQQQQERHAHAYDLLVAADGGWSRVRRVAQKQVPELSSSTEASPNSYKVFRGLPPSKAFPIVPGAPPTDDGTSSAAASAPAPAPAPPPQLRVLYTAGKGLPQPGVMFIGCNPADCTCRGTLILPTHVWEQQGLVAASPETYAAFLARHFPELPPEWLPLMAAQLADRGLAMAGLRVHASQLHGPSLLLVGDAGHGVTPRTGNGMASALEDAWLMNKLLEESGGDLASLPERFTAARLEDARALLWLDDTSTSRAGSSRWGMAHPSALAYAASSLARATLSRATRGWVRPPPLTAMNNDCLPYSQVKAQLQRDDALVAAAVVGGLAALAAACLRRR